MILVFTIIITASFVISPVAKAASIYYVAATGDDSNSGTISSPWRTIQKAADTMVKGDTCMIREGTYHETVIPKNSGAEEAPVKFQAYPGEKVIISGADGVTGWTPYQGGIFMTDVDLALDGKNQIFVDGKMANNARWPNAAGDSLYSGFAQVDSGSNTTLSDRELKQFPDGFFNGATVWVNAGDRWTSQTSTVTNFSSGTLTFKGLTLSDSFNTPKKDNNYYISNSLGALDSPNEWYYDKKAGVLYIMTDGGKPSDKNIQAKRRQYAFDLTGKSYITIENINVFAASVTTEEAHHISITGMTAEYVAHSSTISDPYGSDESGIILSGHDNILSNSTIAYSSGNGVRVSGTNNLLFNNLIHDTDYIGSYHPAIEIYGTGNIISHNTAYNTGRDIVKINGATACKIMYNNFYNSGLICSDLGLLYTVSTDGGNTEISYNWFHDNKAKGASSGIYLDNATSNYIVHHNVVWNAGQALQLNLPGEYILAYNNTLIGDVKQEFAWVFEDDAYGDRLINNIITGNLICKDETVKRYNLTEIDPLFNNTSGNEFDLRAGSPAVDQGETISGVTDGYKGSAPDLGAYEYGAVKWAAGCDFEKIPSLSEGTLQIPYGNRVKNAGFENGDPEHWTKSGTVSVERAAGDTLFQDKGSTRTGFAGIKLGGGLTLPYSFDFDNGSTGWTNEGAGEAVDGKYRLSQSTEPDSVRAFAGDAAWDNYSYTAKMKITRMAGTAAGLLVRYQSEADFYSFSYTAWDRKWTIEKRKDWVSTEIAKSGEFNFDTAREYTVKAEVDGSSLKLYVDGKLQAEATDDDIAKGKIGFIVWDGTVLYDDVTVEKAGSPGSDVPKAQNDGSGDGSGHKVQQVVTGLNPNTRYVLSAWIKVNDGEEAELGVNGTHITVEPTGEGWIRKELPFTTGPSVTSAAIYLTKYGDTSGCVYGDDFGVVEAEAPAAHTAAADKVLLNKESITIETGDSSILKVTILPFNAAAETVEWSSSRPEAAVVDAGGKVTGKSRGAAIITAKLKTNPQIYASCTVEVIPATQYPTTDIKDILADRSGWDKKDVEPVFVNGGIELKGSGMIGYGSKKFESEFFRFRVKADFGAGQWYCIGVRSDTTANPSWSGNNQYAVVFKQDQFELQRWNDGQTMLQIVPNNVLTGGVWHDIKAGAITTGNHVKIIFEVDGQRVISYTDSEKPIMNSGYLNLYNYNEGSTVIFAPPIESLPSDVISRAEFIDALVKASALTADFEGNFSDVDKKSSYYQSIGIARKLGISYGTGNGGFSPKDAVSRQDAAVMVERVMKLMGITSAAAADGSLDMFADASGVDAYAVEAMKTMVNNGLYTATGGSIDPKGALTKEQAALLLDRALKK